MDIKKDGRLKTEEVVGVVVVLQQVSENSFNNENRDNNENKINHGNTNNRVSIPQQPPLRLSQFNQYVIFSTNARFREFQLPGI